jgi:putative oxidoreductase
MPTFLNQSQPQALQSALPFAGRVLISALFLLSAAGKAAAPDATQGYIASVGLPFPELSYVVAIAFELGGAALLLAGFMTRATAFALSAFTVATALVFHNDFASQNEFIHFLKNLAIAGGLLQVAFAGAGRWSVDAWRNTSLVRAVSGKVLS